MIDNVWKVPHPVKVWHDTRQIVFKNKKLLIGIAGVASIAAIMFVKSRRDDTPIFEQTLVKMNAVEEQAVEQMSRLPYTESMDKAAGILQDSTLPEWKEFRQQVATTKNLHLGKDLGKKRKLLVEYADLRVQQAQLLYNAFNENTNAYDQQLSTVYNRINEILDSLQN